MQSSFGHNLNTTAQSHRPMHLEPYVPLALSFELDALAEYVLPDRRN